MLNVAVMVSGGGTNLQSLIDAEKQGKIQGGKIALVISSNPNAYAIERAKKNGIKWEVISKKAFPNIDAFDEKIKQTLKENSIGLVVLAGYLSIVGEAVLLEYKNRIMNIHPSLLPAFCGDGFYGLKVHEAALARGVKVTGATVHFVNEIVDGGEIILQKCVEVKEGDTPETLQKRVMEQAEQIILPKAVALFCQEKVKVRGETV